MTNEREDLVLGSAVTQTTLTSPGLRGRLLRVGRECGGERGIRTLDGLLTHTPLAGERLQPLGHLSG